MTNLTEGKTVNIWYDEVGDFLDVIWHPGHNYFSETDDDRVMPLVDVAGNIHGFKMSNVSLFKGSSLNIDLTPPELRSPDKGRPGADEKWVHICYDETRDYLEVLWQTGDTHLQATPDDRVMAVVDQDRDIYGFKILNISAIKADPNHLEAILLDVDLVPGKAKGKVK